MVDLHVSSLEEQLKRAEEAAREVSELESLASQAPQLREQVAKLQRQEEREVNRSSALELAGNEVSSASEKHKGVPANLDTVAKLVYLLYMVLKEIDGRRKQAYQALSVVDQMDYEQELEELVEQQREMGRDPQSMEYLVASRHGQTRIKQLLDQLDPGFSYLRGCELDEPLRRDVSSFILAQVVTPDKLAAERSDVLPGSQTARPLAAPSLQRSNGNSHS